MYMKLITRCLLLLAVAVRATAFGAAACPPAGYTKAGLLELRQAGFEMAEGERRNALALELLACVGDPDPELRDGVAYEGLATWLRGQSLATETVDALYRGLLTQLSATPDPAGFRRPFAALILSEVARTDRVTPHFSPDRRAKLVDAAAAYLEGVRDYRGFSDTEGWRHGVAHGADLAMQLVLNPRVDAPLVERLLTAVASQVSPPGGHFYIYGEPERLARPVLYAYRRGILDAGFWDQWFARLADPAPLPDWSAAFSSNAGLARRHNLVAFLGAVHLNAGALEGEAGEHLASRVLEALRHIP